MKMTLDEAIVHAKELSESQSVLERENFGLKEYKKHQEKANERRYRGGEESWHRGSVVAKKK